MLLQRILCSSFFINIIQTSFTNHWKEVDIPHAMAKLKDFPSLERYMERHVTEGLYLLQFRKCKDKSCCSLRCKELPPLIPAPVLHPNGEHYLKFNETYGLFGASEKDCPSLQKNGKEKKTKNPYWIQIPGQSCSCSVNMLPVWQAKMCLLPQQQDCSWRSTWAWRNHVFLWNTVKEQKHIHGESTEEGMCREGWVAQCPTQELALSRA